MDSHFWDNINFPNFHSSGLGHCYLFLVKNRVFGLLDRIASKLPQKIRKNSRTITLIEGTSYGTPPLQKIRKNSRTITPIEGTSYGTPPLKIQNSIILHALNVEDDENETQIRIFKVLQTSWFARNR
ncbi:hypothetical protein MTR_4g125570 [Medicago truncatula]|uniref:Uncharacterized protein n=1 Tax=Medicago truncatula TaxID=3880 RepID=A0A072US17_MEDTR|nr:hypothetical protein MTR_4g125570 [Medicago truncatula]